MQRAAIARALINRPRVLLADEPTGNLDAANGQHIMQLLRDLNRQEGLTIVMVTHNLDLVQDTDRVVRLFNGKVEITERTSMPAFATTGAGQVKYTVASKYEQRDHDYRGEDYASRIIDIIWFLKRRWLDGAALPDLHQQRVRQTERQDPASIMTLLYGEQRFRGSASTAAGVRSSRTSPACSLARHINSTSTSSQGHQMIEGDQRHHAPINNKKEGYIRPLVTRRGSLGLDPQEPASRRSHRLLVGKHRHVPAEL